MTLYATLGEFKQDINYPATDNSRDESLQRFLDGAAAVIDFLCHRPEGFVATAPLPRVFDGEGQAYLYTEDCVEVTQVETRTTLIGAWEALTSGTWTVFAGDPLHPTYRGPFEGVKHMSGVFPARGFESVRVTARWGVSETVPLAVNRATIALAARWFKRGEIAWADAASNGEFGQLVYRQAIDPDIKLMLIHGRLVRPTVG